MVLEQLLAIDQEEGELQKKSRLAVPPAPVLMMQRLQLRQMLWRPHQQ